MTQLPDPAPVVEKVFEAYGGADNFFHAMDERLESFNAVWSQDTQSIGRVLRAHLVVEHFLSAYLETANPNLGSLEKARLSFSQKVELLGDSDPFIAELAPGLRRVNEVRNRLSHNLSVSITSSDVDSLLSVAMYRAMREERNKRFAPLSDEPLDVLEHFAQFAAASLQHSASGDSKLWRQAFENVER